jgi:hypothetical protein
MMTMVGVRILGVIAAGWLTTTGCSCRSPDEVQPPPGELPYVEVKLPSSARAYHKYTTGLKYEMSQVRFDMDPEDLPAWEVTLPCRLGAIETGVPEFAHVGTNDRRWYVPERAKKHRGCRYDHGLLGASFLVDVSAPDRVTFYGVLALD